MFSLKTHLLLHSFGLPVPDGHKIIYTIVCFRIVLAPINDIFKRCFTESECLSYCNHNEPAPPGAKTFRCFPRSKSVVLNVIQINLNDNITSVFHVNQVLTDKKIILDF